MSQNCKCSVENGTESNESNRIFAKKKEIVEKDFGHLFVTLNSSHFFNKTVFEQYFLNKNAIVAVR